MNLEESSFDIVTVIQGEFQISTDEKTVLSTILGSCVAVCLFDSIRRVGGMNHFLLPGNSDGSSDRLRYGVHSMELLINGLLRSGAQRSDLQAKVFGGSSMSQRHDSIGTSNGKFAEDFLREEKIPCVSSSLGGNSARRIKFHPTTGLARQFLVPPDVVTEAPKSPPRKLTRSENDITLF